MQNTNDLENAADAALINEHFQKFLNEFTKSGTYLPEITERLLDAFGVIDRRCVIATMVYAFTAGMNAGIGLAMAEDETEEKEG